MSGAIVAVVFMIISVGGTSQPPAPTPPVKRHPPQQQPTTAQAQPAPDPRGTDQSPLIVRVLPTPKTQEETANEQAQREDESAANWWMVRFTGVIVFMTLVQLLVNGLQTKRLRQTIEKMDEIAMGQSQDIAKSIAQAARAAKAIENVSETAAKQMYMSLRARMGLKSIEFRNPGANIETYVILTFENFGGKGALLQEFCLFPTAVPLPPEPTYDAYGWRSIGSPLESGARHQVFFRVSPPMTPEQWAAVNDESGTTRLRFVGALRYNPGFGVGAMTVGFCREYDPVLTRINRTPTFVAVGGNAYNHAD